MNKVNFCRFPFCGTFTNNVTQDKTQEIQCDDIQCETQNTEMEEDMDNPENLITEILNVNNTTNISSIAEQLSEVGTFNKLFNK